MASPLHFSVLFPSFSSCKPSLFSSSCKPSRLHSHTCASVSFSSSISLTSHKPVAASLIEKLGGFKGVKWGDLWSLNSWVVRDYYRLVDSVNALEQIVRRLSDEQSGLFAAEIKDSRVSAAIESRGDFLIASYLQVVEDSGYDNTYIQEVEREVMVKSLDCFWRDHLINMNRLSSAVNVRSFGHRNPLEEYKIDGCRFFISMLSATRRLTVESLLQYWSSPVNSEELFSI